MIFASLISFFVAMILGFFQWELKRKWTAFYVLLPLGLFAFFASYLPEVLQGEQVLQSFSWVPSFGVHLSFLVDGLSLLFLLLITGIGALVFAYTNIYMRGDPKITRFYAYLTLFMGAMIGLVSSDNLITLFIFWELTSISSFFLIGYKNNDKESRRAAIISIAVTGFGGLFLLAFSIYSGVIYGSYSIQEMLTSTSVLEGWQPLILMGLVLVAAFTKSAQFPFHFWLPGAMKAPTPVSTYLHSATMVKAGIYLLLRFNPLFSQYSDWHTILLIFGGFTMLYAAVQTLFQSDMKSILAYSTISALGIIVFLIGIGGSFALSAAIAFIFAHAMYKATLFMITGIVDHQTGTRDITKLGGLGKIMPSIRYIALAAALSNAGVPFFMGFLAKDMIYEGTLNHQSLAVVFTILAITTNVLLIYAGFAVGLKPFVGNLPDDLKQTTRLKSSVWWPPAITAFLGLVFGAVPFLFAGLLANASLSVGAEAIVPLKIWHGFNLVFLLSLCTLALGLILYFVWKMNSTKSIFVERFYRFAPKSIASALFTKFMILASRWTKLAQNGFLRNYVLVIVIALTIALSAHVFRRPSLYLSNIIFTPLSFNELTLSIMLVGSTLFAVFSKSRLAAIAGLAVLGYAVCFVFVLYSAPDLALTQFSIDTLTVILFVLILYNLPPYLRLSNNRVRYRDIGVASVFGVLITLVTLEAIVESAQRNAHLASYFNENAKTLAKGKNIVNVILVDFRGADTLIETVVLAISAIGVFGLVKLRMKEKE